MRVIAGSARGRKLLEPQGREVRPTTDKVKEAIFNIIQFDVPDSSVLDLFAGTGQMGIEALSRGAKNAVFVDRAASSIKIVKENVKTTGFADRAEIFCCDCRTMIESGRKFDIIFLDPPYNDNILENILQKIIEIDILRENGIIVCESPWNKDMPEASAPYRKFREYKYGKIKVTVYVKGADAHE